MIGSESMLRTRSVLKVLLAPLLALTLVACVSSEPDSPGSGDRPVPTPEPTPAETPADEPDPTPAPTEPSDSEEPDDWYELLITEKSYPEERTDEQVLELAESDETYEALWSEFQLDDVDDAPDVNWDNQVVLFAGTGESSGCPLIIDSIVFDEEQRFISIATIRDIPEDTMCTMDWTPRVFVIALDSETLGDGELRAAIYDAEMVDQVDPGDGTIIRESE